MFFPRTRRTHKSLSHRRMRPLRYENLENRELLTTTYMILDFTPDSHAGSFVDTFLNTRLPNGYAPNFLDFNGDRWVNATDAGIAARRVANRVAGFFGQTMKGYDVRVRYGDIRSNSNWGTQWINYGKYYSGVEVAVMYFGGLNREGSGVLGMAPVANDGYNFEGYGETYTRSAAVNMVNWTPNAKTGAFVELVARTAAHELGHMFGLRHIQGNDLRHVMNASTPISPTPASFQNRWLGTSGGWAQNAFQEMRNSFRGQTQQNGQPYLGGAFATLDLGSLATGIDSQALPAGQVDQAMAGLTGDGAMTLEGAQAVADAALALASARAAQQREDRTAAANQDVDRRLLFDEALASREWQPTREAREQAGQPGLTVRATVGQDLQDGTRPLRRAKDRVFGSRFFSRDVLDSEARISWQVESAAGLA